MRTAINRVWKGPIGTILRFWDWPLIDNWFGRFLRVEGPKTEGEWMFAIIAGFFVLLGTAIYAIFTDETFFGLIWQSFINHWSP